MHKCFVAASMAILIATALSAAAEREVSVTTAPPVVVRTVPEAGDVGVDPSLREIAVTFSKEMGTGWSWVTVTKETFPEISGKIHYLPDKRTCVAPVKLEPDRTYAIYLNHPSFTNFRDTAGTPSMSYLLVFRTRK